LAVHPLAVESVVWVSERKGLLAASFSLLCLLDVVSFAIKGRRRIAFRACLFFILAAFSKPTLLGLPIVAVVLRRLILSERLEPARVAAVRKLELALLGIAGCLVSFHMLLQQGTLDSEGPRMVDPLTSAGSFMVYVAKLFYPVDLIIPYQRYHWPLYQSLIAVMLLAGLTFLFWNRRNKEPWLLFGWSWFIVFLFPASGILPLGVHGLANRYLYFPSIGILLLFVFLIEKALTTVRSRSFTLSASVCAIPLIVALGVLSFREVGFWRNTETLFGRTLQLDPSNGIARTILYRNALQRDETERAQSYSAAAVQDSAHQRTGLFNAFY
jgi:hypothetical protein